MANVAYIRVSSEQQNTARQYADLQSSGITLDKTYEEKISGKNTDRPQLKAMLDYLREGDTLYIESLSRLARSTRDLLNITALLEEKKVNLVSLKESIDTQSPQGKLVFTIFSAIAEFERETIKQRQREGIDIALSEGRRYGRPSVEITDEFKDVYKDWKAERCTAVEAFTKLGISKTSFYKLVGMHEGRLKPAKKGKKSCQ